MVTGESRTSGPTAAQRAWVERLGALAGEAPPSGADGRQELAEGVGGERKQLLPIDPTDIPFKVSCDCTIDNETDFVLRLDVGSIKTPSGRLDPAPPNEIDRRERGVTFRATNNPPFLRGAEGSLEYVIDEQGTRWRIGWDNPRFNPFGSNEAPTEVIGPNKGNFIARSNAGPGDQAKFSYALKAKSGPPGPGPVPPTPGADVRSSCLVTVTNQTQHVLTLVDQGGDFMTFPGRTLQPGASTSCASTETPGLKEQGCKGFLLWELGTPAVATWRVAWDNPEQARNTTEAKLEPPVPGLRSLDQIGQGEENVPVVFTLSGDAAPVPPVPPIPPIPPIPPTPGIEETDEFNPPAESRQPTLRKGDKGKDGWVEYLQQLLNSHLVIKLELDGDFGAATEKAVVAFQTREKLQVDKVVGNQTWAALREGQPEKPSTDGRQPHTFHESGAEARWDSERDAAFYFSDTDELHLFLHSVGDAPIDAFKATVKVTPPGAKAKVVKVVIGPADGRTKTGEGQAHTVKIPGFKKRFPAPDPKAPVESYQVEAFLDAALGGDLWQGKVFVA